MIFSDGERTGLKICGVRNAVDLERLVGMGVDAAGFNFWEGSKRFLEPGFAGWLGGFAGRILRVGVFVNEMGDVAFRLFGEGLIDVVQLHGDEGPEVTARYRAAGVPVIKALGVRDEADVERAGEHDADAILLDAHAPEVFGGTGRVFDWGLALCFKGRFPERRLVLAGGITIGNALEAVRCVGPAALDVASGAEVSPGVKDFEKVAGLLAACGGGKEGGA